MKSPFKSKTLWANLFVAAVAFFPGVAEHFSAEQAVLFMTFLNSFLRIVTKDKIGFE